MASGATPLALVDRRLAFGEVGGLAVQGHPVGRGWAPSRSPGKVATIFSRASGPLVFSALLPVRRDAVLALFIWWSSHSTGPAVGRLAGLLRAPSVPETPSRAALPAGHRRNVARRYAARALSGPRPWLRYSRHRRGRQACCEWLGAADRELEVAAPRPVRRCGKAVGAALRQRMDRRIHRAGQDRRRTLPGRPETKPA